MAHLVHLGRKLLKLAILTLALGWLYMTFLAPESEVLVRSDATDAAREHIEWGQWTEALAAIQIGLAEVPEDWELLTWQAVLLEKLGQPSDTTMATALEQGPELDIWIMRGMVALLVDKPDTALDAGLHIRGQSPNIPHGYYLMARSYELTDHLEEALVHYHEAASLAEDNPADHAIYIAARERIFAITSLPE